MRWRSRRQLLYLFVVLLFLAVVIAGLIWYFFPTSTCFDGRQNQGEERIDCGGPCAQACVATTIPLKILWTRVLPVATNRYDVVTMIENQNNDRGIKNVNYKIRLYNREGVILAERLGSTYINPGEKFTIFESGFETANQQAISANLIFTNQVEWTRAKPVPTAISLQRVIENNSFSAPSTTPKLRLKVANNSLKTLKKIKIVSLLTDEKQNVYAGSQTVVDSLEAGQKKEVFFTWPEALKQEPATIDFSWRLNGFEHNVLMP
ncbi:MAG: hypothetical protein UV88_C0008G0003 [Parcubacteria group bacterium GW2011_GWA1_43_21]|uniref:Uncharacterized protein n=1 Tax=Candidatus Vogelbacteria bacterium RIFOXYB1_FULL_42_16 TaxID=1802436 RepID=A0A1G2QGH8_9BACT|nr:MAG: hypothetical protein UV50_C0014G0004 [Parcubacteria group bacterium GW2011_GWB1_42_9]KKT09519.1 MAG: hypothetical protein UV88_C0008G0003 [Parcubacteria group bacterium GW2011_GWA1_43_21]OHA59102.1 MAG: hypothetical protein A2370_02850 [Candidatus Vogelbacteria bacterium RIFOXYB1_FULL_42_16]